MNVTDFLPPRKLMLRICFPPLSLLAIFVLNIAYYSWFYVLCSLQLPCCFILFKKIFYTAASVSFYISISIQSNGNTLLPR